VIAWERLATAGERFTGFAPWGIASQNSGAAALTGLVAVATKLTLLGCC